MSTVGAVNIAFNKAVLLAELVNNAMPLGMGFLDPNARKEMTTDDANLMIEEQKDRDYPLYFDYAWGRPIKVNLAEDLCNCFAYNRDNSYTELRPFQYIVKRLREQTQK